MMSVFSYHDQVDLLRPHCPSCTLYFHGENLTVIGSEDRIFFSSSAKDPEAKGAIPKSASERIKRNTELIKTVWLVLLKKFAVEFKTALLALTVSNSECNTDFETLIKRQSL